MSLKIKSQITGQYKIPPPHLFKLRLVPHSIYHLKQVRYDKANFFYFRHLLGGGGLYDTSRQLESVCSHVILLYYVFISGTYLDSQNENKCSSVSVLFFVDLRNPHSKQLFRGGCTKYFARNTRFLRIMFSSKRHYLPC